MFVSEEGWVCNHDVWCGQPHTITREGNQHGKVSCAGHIDGRPCQRVPLRGLKVCKRHGGGTDRSQARRALNLEEAKATTLLARLGRPEPIQHPIYELIDLGGELKAGVAYFRQRMSELNELYTEDKFGVERERALVLLYERAVDRFSRHLVDMGKLDLATKELALKREAAAQFTDALIKALHVIGLGDHEQELRAEMGRLLRREPEAIAR